MRRETRTTNRYGSVWRHRQSCGSTRGPEADRHDKSLIVHIKERSGDRAVSHPVRVLLERARIDEFEFHGMMLRGLGCGPGRIAKSFSFFFPKTSPAPRSGRVGATAAEHSCPAGPAGPLGPAQDDAAGMPRRSVELLLHRLVRSASDSSFPRCPSP